MHNIYKFLILTFILGIVFFNEIPISSTIHTQASYYSESFHGRKTASGEIFNKNAFTCAHKKLPFGTLLLITNKSNNKQVIVKVNDRGPYIKGREIDLSYRAAKCLGMLKQGVAHVKVEIINNDKLDKKVNNLNEEYSFLNDTNKNKYNVYNGKYEIIEIMK